MDERMYIFVLGVKVSGYTQYIRTEYSWGTSLDNAMNNKWCYDSDERLGEDVVVLNAYALVNNSMLLRLV
jgi:hypothetical protein